MQRATKAPRAFTPEQALGPLNEVERKHAPQWLYVAGDVRLLRARNGVAIVGARAASAQGLARARRLARFLAGHGIPVISGLAAGIDAAAHLETMAAGGKTIAVLGTPLDQIYPQQHAELQRRIAAEHCALSQFAPGSSVARGNFIRRNRTMALVSTATVIVEAGDSSGSLSQGWEALRLGRPLFIMRSVLATPGLTWPQKMQDHGAMALAEPDDLLECVPSGVTGGAAAAAF